MSNRYTRLTTANKYGKKKKFFEIKVSRNNLSVHLSVELISVLNFASVSTVHGNSKGFVCNTQDSSMVSSTKRLFKRFLHWLVSVASTLLNVTSVWRDNFAFI